MHPLQELDTKINGIVNGNTTWFEGTFNLILAETKVIIG